MSECEACSLARETPRAVRVRVNLLPGSASAPPEKLQRLGRGEQRESPVLLRHEGGGGWEQEGSLRGILREEGREAGEGGGEA